MKAKFTVLLGMAAIIVAAACGGQPEPVIPQPDPDSIAREQARRDSIAREQARLDSIRRAQAEQDRIRREREEAARREAAITAEVRQMLASVVNFDFDRSNIRMGRDTDMLQQKLSILQANPALRIEVTGHCDERGSDEYNMALGMRRANAAKKWLTDRGVAESRITVRSMGEEQPKMMGSTEDAWAQNRRDEFSITAGGDKLVKPAGM
ncbi:MAG: OmpA family protein [Gemmatimonadota bacterium]|nr:OmpA family protein [Gemmatimonadota bacterium]